MYRFEQYSAGYKVGGHIKIFFISVAGVAIASFFGSFELMAVAFGGKPDV